MDLFSHSAMKKRVASTPPGWNQQSQTVITSVSVMVVFLKRKKKSPQCIYTHSSSHKYEITRSAEQTLIHTDLQDVGSQQQYVTELPV